MPPPTCPDTFVYKFTPVHASEGQEHLDCVQKIKYSDSLRWSVVQVCVFFLLYEERRISILCPSYLSPKHLLHVCELAKG